MIYYYWVLIDSHTHIHIIPQTGELASLWGYISRFKTVSVIFTDIYICLHFMVILLVYCQFIFLLTRSIKLCEIHSHCNIIGSIYLYCDKEIEGRTSHCLLSQICFHNSNAICLWSTELVISRKSSDSYLQANNINKRFSGHWDTKDMSSCHSWYLCEIWHKHGKNQTIPDKEIKKTTLYHQQKTKLNFFLLLSKLNELE